jgi:hypothetical protein
MRRREFTLWLAAPAAHHPSRGTTRQVAAAGILVIGSADIVALIKALQDSLARLPHRRPERRVRVSLGRRIDFAPAVACGRLVNLKVDLIVAFQSRP